MTHQTIESRFRKNTINASEKETLEKIRNEAIAFGKKLVDLCPEGRCLTVAITRLEECVSFAKSSIYRNSVG